MIKILSILLLFSCGLINCQQQEYQQCGGQGYTGVKTCVSGLTCYKKDDYYSQCLKSCPAGWACTTGTNTQAPATQAPVTQAAVSTGKFPACSFRFGAQYLPNKAESEYAAVDYISIWVGTISSDFGTDFNKWYHGKMLEIAVKYKKIPLYYGYIIAFMARHMANLQDCDVVTQGNNLCEKGANFIRNNRAAIIAKYKHYALESAKIIGKQSEIIWLIEPDFWQYTGKKQLNGGLDGAYMRKLFDDIAVAIKSELPNARISWDISAWLTEAEMTTWWGNFASSSHIDFIHTSGGQSNPASLNIKANELKWSFMSSLTKKKIIADTGYGVGGNSDGHNNAYDSLTNINARIKDGVIAVTQANSRSDWANILSKLRPTIPKLC